MALNDRLDQMDLWGIFRTFHHKTAEYTFSSSTHGSLSRTHYMSQNKSQQIKEDWGFFWPQCYETRNQPKEKVWKEHKYMEVNNMLPNDEWVNQEIKEKIKKNTWDKWKWFQIWGEVAKGVLRGKFAAKKAYLKKQEKCQPNFRSKRARKNKETPKPVERRK